MPKNSQTKSTLSPEFRFLIACCQTDPTEKEIAYIQHFIQKQHSDLTCLAIASSHGILPLVYKAAALHTQQTEDHTLLTELKTAYMSIVQKNMFMTAKLIKIMQLFKQHHIEALAFKGPTLSQTVYGDITLRQYGDLDILVQHKDLPAVMFLMREEGYMPDVHIAPGQEEHIYRLLTVIGFDKPSARMRIEIHWELLSRNYAISWDKYTLWEKTEHVEINHTPIPALAFEHQLLYLCVHGSKHLFERLEWICDIDRSVRAHPDTDWEKVSANAENLGVQRMLLLGLSLAQHFFRLPLPEQMQYQIAQDRTIPKLVQKIIELHFSASEAHSVDKGYFFTLLQMRERTSDKVRFSYQAFFAPQFNDFNYLPLPTYLNFLYPLVRLYRLGEKYLFNKTP